MKFTESEEHTRYIDVSELPDGLPDLTLDVRYKGEGGAIQGIALDHHVMPVLTVAAEAVALLRKIGDGWESGLDARSRYAHEVRALLFRIDRETGSKHG